MRGLEGEVGELGGVGGSGHEGVREVGVPGEGETLPGLG